MGPAGPDFPEVISPPVPGGGGSPRPIWSTPIAYSYGPHTTTGTSSKLCMLGGLGVCHSSPVALHGLDGAFFPKNSESVRYTPGIEYPRPRMLAPAVLITLSTWRFPG